MVSSAYILTTPPVAASLLGGFGQTVSRLGNNVLSDLTLVGFFAAAALGAPILSTVLHWKPLAFIGLVSYSMFVFHQTILLFAKSSILLRPEVREFVTRNPSLRWLPFLGYLFGIFGVVLLISYLGYRFIESPFLHRKPK